MTVNDAVQWALEHAGTIFGSTGFGGAVVALAHTRRIRATADARVQTALADALDGMRGDLDQMRAMATEALERSRACESEREREREERDAEKAVYDREARAFEEARIAEQHECRSQLEALRGELEDLRRQVMSQHSTRGAV
jgi:signal transduction histidine kinase